MFRTPLPLKSGLTVLLYFCLVGGISLPFSAFSQTEVNVKIYSGETNLRQYFDQHLGQTLRPNDAPRTLATPYPFVDDVRMIRALRKPSPQLDGPDLIYTLRMEGSDPQIHVQALLQSGAFEFVEENRTRSLHKIEVDPPNDDSVSNQWYHSYIRTFDAWDNSRGNTGVRIGVLDTGLDFGHPEFEGQVAVNAAEDLNGNGSLEAWPSTEMRNGQSGDFDEIDNDGNGYTDDVAGYDFTDQPRSPFGGDYLFEDADPSDDNGHGTSVAGVIFAQADNGIGGAGIAPNCRAVVLRAFAASGNGEDDDIARAIIYAADNGISILNFSFGDVYPSFTMHEAIKYAYAKGVVMISSAGNGTGDELHYPSGFNEVISVSASTADLENDREFLWPLSSYGLTVDLCAPGSSIFTTALRDTASDGTITSYRTSSGTSVAAPMVAATVGLIFSHKGYRSPQQVRGMLTSTTDDISEAGWDHFTGAGRLNVARTLEAIGISRVQISSPENDRGSAGDSVWIVGSVIDPEFETYHLEWQPGIEDLTPWNPILSDQIYQVIDDTLGLWDLSEIPEGEYTLRIRVEKSDGFTAEDRIRFIRDLTPPEIEIRQSSGAWDNQERKHLIIFRSSDQGLHTLNLRRVGDPEFQQIPFDRTTRNGDYLLGPESIASGEWEFFIQSTNLAGLSGQSALQPFSFQNEFVDRSGFSVLDYTLPMGRYLPETYDFDQDGLKEVVLNEYAPSLASGKLKILEFNGGFFTEVDSISSPPVLLPKDVADADQDGLLELLASVNDSTFLYEQATPTSFPTGEPIFTMAGDTLFPARFGDVDGDGDLELITKNFRDYVLLERSGTEYQESTRLKDVSPNYQGSIAPRALVNDFDGDGKQEVIYGDFDGDLLIYEHTGGTQFELTYSDTTNLTKSGVYLNEGDFDGDGKPEFFMAAHTTSLRNGDFEYNTPHWMLRIYKSTDNDIYEVVWQDILYDIDQENFNAATAGNVDTDPADELIFTTFPRTYLIDYDGMNYGMAWYRYGDLATHHLIADFNGNGVNEIAIGRGDTAFFYEQNFLYTGPKTVTSLTGKVLGPTEVQLNWQASSNATSYDILRVQDPDSASAGILISGVTGTTFEDSNAPAGSEFLYVMRSRNPGLSPDSSGFGNFMIFRPHPLPKVDSVVAVSARQVEVYFTETVLDRQEDKGKFKLNDEFPAIALSKTGNPGKRLVLSFAKSFTEGWNQLVIDTTFQDGDFACLDPGSRSQSFFYEQIEEEALYLNRWEAVSDQEAILYFNLPLEEVSALDSTNYSVLPTGAATAVEWASDDMDAVKVTIDPARIGALGYAVSITATDVCAINDICVSEEGSTATFSSHKADLSEVFAYPNPAIRHEQFDGIRFANLTQQATIKVYNVSGRYVNTIEEKDGDGGVEWDLRDVERKRLKPGIYIYHVTTEEEGVEEFVGKLSVVE